MNDRLLMFYILTNNRMANYSRNTVITDNHLIYDYSIIIELILENNSRHLVTKKLTVNF